MPKNIASTRNNHEIRKNKTNSTSSDAKSRKRKSAGRKNFVEIHCEKEYKKKETEKKEKILILNPKVKWKTINLSDLVSPKVKKDNERIGIQSSPIFKAKSTAPTPKPTGGSKFLKSKLSTTPIHHKLTPQTKKQKFQKYLFKKPLGSKTPLECSKHLSRPRSRSIKRFDLKITPKRSQPLRRSFSLSSKPLQIQSNQNKNLIPASPSQIPSLIIPYF